MATSMVDLPTKTFFVPPFRHVPQHHFKKNLSHQIQCWLRINCGRAFVWEMTYPWEISNIILIIVFLTIFIPPFISGKLTWPQKKYGDFIRFPLPLFREGGDDAMLSWKIVWVCLTILWGWCLEVKSRCCNHLEPNHFICN